MNEFQNKLISLILNECIWDVFSSTHGILQFYVYLLMLKVMGGFPFSRKAEKKLKKSWKTSPVYKRTINRSTKSVAATDCKKKMDDASSLHSIEKTWSRHCPNRAQPYCADLGPESAQQWAKWSRDSFFKLALLLQFVSTDCRIRLVLE